MRPTAWFLSLLQVAQKLRAIFFDCHEFIIKQQPARAKRSQTEFGSVEVSGGKKSTRFECHNLMTRKFRAYLLCSLFVFSLSTRAGPSAQ